MYIYIHICIYNIIYIYRKRTTLKGSNASKIKYRMRSLLHFCCVLANGGSQPEALYRKYYLTAADPECIYVSDCIKYVLVFFD